MLEFKQRPVLELVGNPILQQRNDPGADLTKLTSPTVIHRKQDIKRELRDLRRAKTAAEAIGEWDFTTEIFGFTKGAFSAIDIISHILSLAGDSDIVLSAWTAAKVDIGTVFDMESIGKVRSARWLFDLTFQRRSPELAHEIRRIFGYDAIRVAKNHAKFTLIGNEKHKIVLRTSMNINFNPRFEDFTIIDDPELYDFIMAIIDEIWSKQAPEMANANPQTIKNHFSGDL